MARARGAALAAAAAALLAAGCAAADRSNGGQAMATPAGETGRGWIVTDDAAAAAVLRTCSRASPDREAALPRWTPTADDVAKLEAALPTIAEGSDPAAYNRQYVGFERDGRRYVYINAWPLSAPSPADPSREAMRVCDGGAQFWGAVWDPGSGRFSDLAGNGGWR